MGTANARRQTGGSRRTVEERDRVRERERKECREINIDNVMCRLAIVIGIRERIGSIYGSRTNCAQNCRAIRTQIRTYVEGP
jgi:hypothetical protein